jgi:formyl-CoA transferase
LNAKFPVRGEGKHPPNPLTAAYLSRDGKIFLLVLIDPDNEFLRLCRAFGQPDLATGELFSTNDGRDRNAAALYAILQSEFESRDLAQWRTIFKSNDIKWAPLPKLDDVVKDPQMRAAQAFIKMDHPGAGVLETVNSPLFVSGVEKRKPTAAAEVGAHTREVLQELGYNADAIESIIRDSAQR